MKLLKRFEKRVKSDSVVDSILWPFIFVPVLWIGLIHVATRIAWYLGLK